jgi:stearoyl-CoA desaturase (delta-9 desaturase)
MDLFWVAFAVAYTWGVLGISLGYHRGLSHRSFKMPVWLEYFFVLGGYFVFEGGPIFWVASHRLHHRYSDRPGDPHSPNDGGWHAFLGWMSKPIVNISEEEYKVLCPDLFKDPFYRFLHAGGSGRDGYLCLAINVIARLGLLAIFGPMALAGNVLGSAAAFIAPLLVNSICHMPRFGYQNYKTTDLSQNVWFVAIASFGEGWHNNHHRFPQSARHGLKPIEFDFSWAVLSTLSAFGLARNIRLPKTKASADAPQVLLSENQSEDQKLCELADSLSQVWSESEKTEEKLESSPKELTRR